MAQGSSLVRRAAACEVAGQGMGGAEPSGPRKYSEIARECGWADVELIESIERDIVETGVTTRWEHIADLREAKQLLQEAVVLPLWMPDYFKGIRRPWKGVLLFGPPGTGKTMLAKAVATEGGAAFLAIDASSIENKWLGESEKNAKAVFSLARRLPSARALWSLRRRAMALRRLRCASASEPV